MDGGPNTTAKDIAPQGAVETLRIAQVDADRRSAATELADQLGRGPFAMICVFASPAADFPMLCRDMRRLYRGADVLACTTAGELGEHGYEEGQIVAIGFPADLFAAETLVIENLDALDEQAVIDRLIHGRMALNRRAPQMGSEFAFLMVDGLSLSEEHLTSVMTSGLGPMPLFGGSAGDGENFSATWLARNGTIFQNAALVALVRSHCPVKVFSLDNLVPTQTRMVVTAAQPENRVVHEINAEPAGLEYARLLGKDPQQLTTFTFAAHPVVVRLGDTHHVRAIQRVEENGDLLFFSAIDEGMVLTLADHSDIADHLQQGLAGLTRDVAPDRILACDCLLRRLEATQKQRGRAVSETMVQNRVVGFSTYGEQIGALHVNQTLTGVAIYPPALPVPSE